MTIDLRLFDVAAEENSQPQSEISQPQTEKSRSEAENTQPQTENSHSEAENSDLQTLTPEQEFQTRLRELRAQRVMQEQKILELAAQRYGVAKGDIAALERAVSEDMQYRRQNSDMAARLNVWRAQSAGVRELYPDFDLNKSLSDRRFFSLVYRGIDLKTAYEITHRDEIISAAMAYAVREMKRRAAPNASAADRPREGALSSSAGIPDAGAKTLSRKQRGELIRRAERGERVTL